MIKFIKPEWPAPSRVKALMTTRAAGNFALIDDRVQLKKTLNLPTEPLWLTQQHTTVVISADNPQGVLPVADASYSQEPGHVCVVQTADCLPVLICDRQGTEVAAIHAGWRGHAGGIIKATVDQLKADSADLMVWMGAAIGPQAFEVGDDVIQAFLRQNNALASHFKPKSEGKYWGDLYAITRFQLANLGITQVYGGDRCTYSEPDFFYSYRRDGLTGRMASLIWLS